MLSKAATGPRTINRKLFHEAIVQEFEEYCQELESGTADVRARFLRRMDAICGLPVRPGSLYFAYGSNLLRDEIRVSAPNAQPEGRAYVPGWRLVFTKHSSTRAGDAASIETCASRVLWGFVYRVSAEDKDGLKDRERGYAEKPLKVLLVEDTSDCENCTPVDAFTFVGETACPDRCGPAAAYFKLVVDGAKKRGLPEEYIRDLEAQAARK